MMFQSENYDPKMSIEPKSLKIFTVAEIEAKAHAKNEEPNSPNKFSKKILNKRKRAFSFVVDLKQVHFNILDLLNNKDAISS